MDDLPPIAPGYTKCPGDRPPSKRWGDKVFVQLRNGMCPDEPWPVGRTKSGQTRWIWDKLAPEGDIIAIKALAGVGKKDGRQANGSYE